jgi:YD repeat-containing protein
MKNTLDRLHSARAMSRSLLLLTYLTPLAPVSLWADGPVAPPLLEFASGLPGKQVRLSWASQTGVRYAVEKSTTLATGGVDGWTQVALVEATGPGIVWLDPVRTTTKAFYRVSQPQAEVFSISFPVLTSVGGELRIQGQCIPPGSFLVIQVPGQAPILVPLSSLGNGEWQALVSGTFDVGGEVTAVRIQSGTGVTLVTLNQPLTITETGRALDSPSSLPPGAPVAQSNPIPGVGIVIKRNHGKPGARVVSNIGSSGNDGVEIDLRKLIASNIGSSGQDGVEVKWRLASSNIGSSGQDGVEVDLGSSFWLSKRGYDYYKAASDNAAAGLQTNPAFQSNSHAGEMPRIGSKLVKEIEYARLKHPDLMKRGMGPGAISPAPSGLPGEVSLQFCALSLETPAGPPLQLIHTYRSKKPSVSTGGGSGTASSHWERCYDISIKPIPSTAGSNATRVEVGDGGGRCDIFYRQSDGTYRCDGMFREGSFVGDTFTLTFADKGTWTFNPLSDPNAPGRIAAITDRNDVALACIYNGSGQLESVSSQFGQSLTMTYGSDGSLSNVSDHSGRSVYYTYCGPQDPDGNEGDLKSISAPQVGSSSPFGPTTFTYLTGQKIPELNGNLLSITDGASRLLEAFTYSTQSDPTAVDFDTCATHDRHRTSSVAGGMTGEVVTMSFEPLSSGAYTMTENDELGRVTQTTFDRLHRETSVREYTGFATPGAVVTSASLPLSGKLYQTDPDFFETTCAYNADSRCTRITRPDGSQELTTYDRDFRKGCPVRERGNARVMTLRTPGGEMRTVRNDYLPGFGNPESARPGAPIGGLSIKGGRNPGGNIQAQGRKGGMVNGAINVASANRKGWDGTIKGNHNYRKGWDGSVKGKLVDFLDMDSDDDGHTLLKKEEGGRHTPFLDKRVSAGSVAGITGGAVAGIVVGAVCATGDVDEDCDGRADNDDRSAKIGPKQKAWLCSNFRISTVSAYGQVSTFGYDANGNCTSATSPVTGRGSLFSYNANGQLTTSTVLNGSSPSFTDECAYDGATGFLSSIVSDPAGLHITTSFERDNLGLVTRVVDPLGNDWLYQYNALDDCVQIQSPPSPSRISTNFTTDASGCVARCDVEHRAPDGSLNSANPVYSTFFVRDGRCRLVQIAAEERPVNSPPAALAPAPSDLASYDVCNITLDNAGQVTRVSTPAACRGQATDLACDFTYTERGQLHRCIEGGLGTVGAVTTEYGYDLVGAILRCTTLADAPADSPQTMFSYDGFHRLSSFTDPMGNIETYEYGNDGSVTTSLHGEMNDVPGSTANVLLARCVCKSGFMGPNLLALMKAKEKANRTKCANGLRQTGMGTSLFFEVELEDVSFTVERFTPGSTAPPVTEVTTIDRSPAGLIQQIRCNGDVLANISYDSAGRSNASWNGACSLTVTRNANGQILVCGETNHFSAGGTPGKTFTLTRAVDALGRCIQTTDGVGNTASCAYDSLGRCVSETEPGGLVVHTAYDGGSSPGAFSSQVSADLDSDGNPDVLSSSLVRCGELVSTTDSHGFPTTFTNDALGRCVRSDSPDGTFESIVFNRQRFVATATFSDGTQCDYTHDLNGQVKTITWSNLPSSVVAVAPKSMQYDGLGNLRSCAQGTSTVTATYDSCGAQTSETTNGLTVSRTFNQRGCTGRTYADGKRFAENRNAFGELVSVSAVTPTGQVISPPVVSMDYMGHQVCRTVQGNGVTTAFTFRADGEASPAGLEDRSFGACVRELITDASSNVLSNKVTTRDSNQRQIRCDTGFSVAGTEKSRLTVSYRDLLGNVSSSVISRRDSATSPLVEESSVSYTRDLDGTRLTEVRNSVAGAYTKSSTLPPGDQQMGQYSSWPGGALTWDANGNMATFQKGTGQLTFVHDAEGRLVRVNNSTGNPVIGYGYDATGRRSEQLHPSPTTGNLEIIIKFVYDDSVCIQELGTDNLADMTFVCADGVRQCISTRNGTIYYPHGGGAANTTERHHARLAKERYGMSRKLAEPGEIHENLNGRISLLTSSSGTVIERFDCDDASKPIFLTSDGLPSSGTSSSIGLRWLSPECAWEPAIGMFACPSGIYSPDLGQQVSSATGSCKFKEASLLMFAKSK